MNLQFDKDSVLSADAVLVEVQSSESTQSVPIVESSGKKRKLSSESSTNQENATNVQKSAMNPQELAMNPQELAMNPQEITSGQIFIPVISESGDPLYHLPVLTCIEGYHEDAAKPAKKVLDEKELKSLRIQMAMLSDLDGDRPIHIAVVQEKVKIVRKLCALMLKAGISLDIVNYNRQTPLHLAVMVGNKELVVLLLKCGACFSLRDRRGNTVLHLAVKSNAKKDMLALLLERSEAKSIINMLDYEGYSALHYSVIIGNGCLMRCFHKYKADMNVPDGKSGRSPLIHAILFQNDEMVRLLLECGADPDTADYSGRSAFEMALLASNKRIVKLVEKNMSSKNLVQTKDRTDAGYRTSDRSPKTDCSEITNRRSKRVCRSNTYPEYEES
ncbi:hypothetical protein JTE90_022945 [Oedothorax gibbosus]|uniref:Uncharacterized protein n=1 Tax=Oedothorax gibbosus TaxID=931172 RepID=A0AAV6U745_9ARAC|nr:hypothetical protein JTE90_022945 [Oedothorax gibbosus]